MSENLTINQLPLTAKQKRDLGVQIERYVSLKQEMSLVEKDAKIAQDAVRRVVESLGVDKFTLTTPGGDTISTTYTPTTKETVDPQKLIELGVDPKIVRKATKVTSFFTLKMATVK